jgi:hypothetical protein
VSIAAHGGGWMRSRNPKSIKEMEMRKILFAAMLAVPLGAMSVAAFAQSAPPAASPTAPPAAQQQRNLTETEILQGLKAEGYTDIKTLKASGDEYQLQAKKDGKPVVLMVDARTGRYKEANS